MKKTCDEAKRIEEALIVMSLSPTMEILQHKEIIAKDATIPIVTQFGEVINNEVPSNPFIVGLQGFYLNMEKVYAHMIVDLDTGQEYKQQIQKNWKARKRKANPRDLDSIFHRSMV